MLVDEDKCIGCGLCAWACPYGAREFDADVGRDEEVHALHRPHLQREPRRKPTACRPASPPARRGRGTSATSAIRTRAVSQLVAERGGVDLMPELGYRPTNKYLPPRERRPRTAQSARPRRADRRREGGFLGWIDRRAVALSDASGAFHHLLHHRLRRRLRPAGAARACWRALGLVPTDALVRRRRPRLALALITAGLLSSTLHLGASGAGVAGLLAMALVLALARGRDERCDLRPRRPVLALGWVVLGQTDGVFAAAGIAGGGLVRSAPSSPPA